jgi:ribosome-associated toxin RatA of RatAB toxin-antitoxin module
MHCRAQFTEARSRCGHGRQHLVGLRAKVCVTGVLLPMAAWSSPAAWVDDQTVQQELAAGQVAVQIAFEDGESRMRVHAAVRVHATPETIWRVLTDCDHAANFIPGVKHCRRVQSAPDGSWDILEQEAKYSWLMPAIKCVIRAEYKRPQRIDFKRISGDLKEEEGHWKLEDPAGPEATVVEYELQVDPGFWIPRVLLRHSLRTELPAALKAVRARSESLTAQQ